MLVKTTTLALLYFNSHAVRIDSTEWYPNNPWNSRVEKMDTDNDGVISKQEFDASGSVADVEFDDFVIQDADDIANWIWLVCKHTPSNPICTEHNKAAVNIFDVEKF